MQELFCNISFHGEGTVSYHDHFVLQFWAKFNCCLHLLSYDIINTLTAGPRYICRCCLTLERRYGFRADAWVGKALF